MQEGGQAVRVMHGPDQLNYAKRVRPIARMLYNLLEPRERIRDPAASDEVYRPVEAMWECVPWSACTSNQ